MQHQDGAMIRLEPAEASIERVAILDVAGGVGMRGDLAHGGSADRLASLAVRLAVDAADEDSMQPGVEPIEITQALQVAPGENQCLLDGVGGEIAVPEHELGDVEEPPDGVRGEARERLAIASSGPFHQLSPHGLVPHLRQSAPVSN